MRCESFDVDEAGEERGVRFRVAFVGELVDEALAAACGVHDQVLELEGISEAELLAKPPKRVT